MKLLSIIIGSLIITNLVIAQDTEDFDWGCNEGVLRATQKFENFGPELVLVSSFSNPGPRYRMELKALCRSLKLTVTEETPFCESPDETYCYQSTMDSLIDVKYGAGFLDSLKIEADQLYKSKYLSKVYNVFEIDTRPEPKGRDTVSYPIIQYLNSTIDSSNKFKYVANVIGNSLIEFEFIVDRYGEVVEPKIIRTEFNYNENYELRKAITSHTKRSFERYASFEPGTLGKEKVATRLTRGFGVKIIE